MQVSIIVAMASNRVIGVENRLPWHLPADLRHFKAVTMGKPVIMGRKTYDSIGQPLPGRKNIVITRDKAWHADGVHVVHDVDDAFACAGDMAEAMIIGGAEIYRLTLARTKKLYVTEVALHVDGDARFPAISPDIWQETSRDTHPAEGDKPAYAFVTYDRKV